MNLTNDQIGRISRAVGLCEVEIATKSYGDDPDVNKLIDFLYRSPSSIYIKIENDNGEAERDIVNEDEIVWVKIDSKEL